MLNVCAQNISYSKKCFPFENQLLKIKTASLVHIKLHFWFSSVAMNSAVGIMYLQIITMSR